MQQTCCEVLVRPLLVRRPRPFITTGFLFALLLSVSSLIFLSYYVVSFHSILSDDSEATPPSTFHCRTHSEGAWQGGHEINDHTNTTNQLRIDNKVLVLVETPYTPLCHDIVTILEATRIRFKVELAGKSLPSLTHSDKGKFGVVIFERLESYLNMDKWNRQLLDKYCVQYRVGLIAFAQPDESYVHAQVKGFPLSIHSKLTVGDYELNPSSPVLRLTRAGEILSGQLPAHNWTVFMPNHSTYSPVSWVRVNPFLNNIDPSSLSDDFNSLSHNHDDDDDDVSQVVSEKGLFHFTSVIHDKGEFDGIQRVIFGNGLWFWLHRLLFIDSLSFLSHGKFSSSLDRYVLVDVDDIFVGRNETRMKRNDVKAMVKAQYRIRQIVKDFRFNLGFSGWFYCHGTAEENEGDRQLIDSRQEFWWFGHSWKHLQPHKIHNYSAIEEDMLLNQAFARLHDIPTNQSYSVAPHHAGVFPVHEELYDAWKKVWGIRVTSTEEYPHLVPDRFRRGFIHKDIMVLPRQTCGLFTHTIFFKNLTRGKAWLVNTIHGGELFQLIVTNQVNVFMTHMSNYGNDRLALFVFENLFKFVQCWTNLRLQTVPPVQLADIYFTLHPDEVDPIWRNPCDDPRHVDIWSDEKSCDRLPHVLIIGPQKTGTTALYTFLGMHPSVVSNYESVSTYEEVQFFNGRNYRRGLDWYMEHFPLPSDNASSSTVVFEKSANYFDSDEAPRRAYALLPRAKLICILIDPAKRAYSWYQHMKAHGDQLAVEHSFLEIIKADETSSKAMREIRNRCLIPGLYSQHIDRWLYYYDSSQMLLLDGDSLRDDPIQVMNRVQSFLTLDPYIDYTHLLKYDPHKGFFCQITSTDKTKCLGKGKGRSYAPMDLEAKELLRKFYRKANIALSKLLVRLEQPVPDWLEEELGYLR